MFGVNTFAVNTFDIGGAATNVVLIGVLSDSLGAQDIAQISLAISETVGMAEVLARSEHGPRTLMESLDLSESLALVAIGTSTHDSLMIEEFLLIAGAHQDATLDAIGLSDQAHIVGLRVHLTESLGLVESLIRQGQHARILTASLGMSESTSNLKVLHLSLSDVMGLDESLTVRGLRDHLLDELGLSESAQVIFKVADTLGLAEVLTDPEYFVLPIPMWVRTEHRPTTFISVTAHPLELQEV